MVAVCGINKQIRLAVGEAHRKLAGSGELVLAGNVEFMRALILLMRELRLRSRSPGKAEDSVDQSKAQCGEARPGLEGGEEQKVAALRSWGAKG